MSAAGTVKAGTDTYLVYGVGNTGLSVARFLARRGLPARFVDTRSDPPGRDALGAIVPDAETVFGEVSTALLDGVTRLVVSPGIGDRDPLVAAARERGIDVVSDIQVFVEHAAAPFVAVTGSNGKSTVTTLIARMCEAAGRRVLAGANLGEPALDLLAQDVPELYVLELSSFQLQRTRDLPARLAVLLNISPDHLDWHRDEAEYREAKYRILREAEAVVINRNYPDMRERVPAGATCRSFALDRPKRSNAGIVERDGEAWLALGESALMPAAELGLVGLHNRENALAALAACDLLGLPAEPALEALKTFPGLPHRMQFVRDRRGVRFVNDSKATNVAAAVSSVLSVDGPVVLVAGGQGKGGDFGAFADAVQSRLRAAVLIGEDAGRIGDAIAGRTKVLRADSMRDAVAIAGDLAERGDTVLLAPACASFDMFENYQDRGDTFSAAAQALPS